AAIRADEPLAVVAVRNAANEIGHFRQPAAFAARVQEPLLGNDGAIAHVAPAPCSSPGLTQALSGLAPSQSSLLHEYSVVIIGLVPMIHDFAARPRRRGWSASADHDDYGMGASPGSDVGIERSERRVRP